MSLYTKKTGKNYYWKFGYEDENGLRRLKSLNTGVQNRPGNKKEAAKQGKLKEEAFRSSLKSKCVRHRDRISEFTGFTVKDYIDFWLISRTQNLRTNTHYEYEILVRKHIIPFIGEIKIAELDQFDLEDFLGLHIQRCAALEKSMEEKKSKGMKIKSEDRPYTASIGKIIDMVSMILTDAVSAGAITENPAKKISRSAKKKIPRSDFKGTAYSFEELNQLFDACKGEVIEPAVMLAGYLALRREEALALKWEDVDFVTSVIRVRNTVVTDGGKIEYRDNRTKTETSRDELPMIEPLKNYLIGLKKKQEEDRDVFGEGYFKSDYICRWADGTLIKPDYLSRHFSEVLRKNNLRKIRYHDLRGTVVTLVWAQTHDIKTAQIIARHAHIDMTADVYTDAKIEEKRRGLEEAFKIKND